MTADTGPRDDPDEPEDPAERLRRLLDDLQARVEREGAFGVDADYALTAGWRPLPDAGTGVRGRPDLDRPETNAIAGYHVDLNGDGVRVEIRLESWPVDEERVSVRRERGVVVVRVGDDVVGRVPVEGGVGDVVRTSYGDDALVVELERNNPPEGR